MALGRAARADEALGYAGLLSTVLVFFGLWFTAHYKQGGLAHSFDENSYLFQATQFAHGRLALPLDKDYWPLRDWWVLDNEGKSYSKYAPGYPSLLAVGVWLKSAEAVNPFLCAATLIVLFAAITVQWSWAVAGLSTVVLATNSYWLGYGASFHSQPAALFWVSLLVLGITLRLREPLACRSWYVYGIWGVAIAALVSTRPLDGFCAALALVLAFPRRFFSGRWIFFSVLVASGITVLFTYNYVQSGHFSVASYPLVDKEFKISDPSAKSTGENLSLVAKEYVGGLKTHVWPLLTQHLLGRMGLALALLMLWGAVVMKEPALRRFGAVFLALLVVLYNFHHTLGWPQYGARYYYPAMAGLAVYAADAIAWGYQRHPKAAVLLVLGTLAVQIPHHLIEVSETTARFTWISRIRTEIDRHCPKDAIVALEGTGWRSPNPWVFPEDFSKNLLPWDGRYYAAQAWPLETLQLRFPERPVCRFVFKDRVPSGGS